MARTSCQLAIIGAGPAGMAAATQAVALGLDTVVLDEQPAPGGQIYRAIETVQTARTDDLRILGEEYAEGAALAASFRAAGAAYEPDSTVWQALENGRIGVSCGGAAHMLSAERILFATGAMERPVPIPGWTLPGVMAACRSLRCW
jgi:thioredoxin reductase